MANDQKELSETPQEGYVSFKVFNLLLPELGPLFLRKGILISREDFQEFWDSLVDMRERLEEKIRVEGKGLPPDQVRPLIGSLTHAWISLVVHSER